MSHHTHVFLSNEENAEACMSWVNAYLDGDMCISHGIDGVQIIGALNLDTGEFTKDKYNKKEYEHEPTSVEKLEPWANSLFGKEKYEHLLNELKREIENKGFWRAARICEELDGIDFPTKCGMTWTAEYPFAVNDSYLEFRGITDWRTIDDSSEAEYEPKTNYAVLVDFHS